MPQNIMKCFIAAGYLSVLGRSHPGAREGIRTPNLLIRSQMLYPLSYARQWVNTTDDFRFSELCDLLVKIAFLGLRSSQQAN